MVKMRFQLTLFSDNDQLLILYLHMRFSHHLLLYSFNLIVYYLSIINEQFLDVIAISFFFCTRSFCWTSVVSQNSFVKKVKDWYVEVNKIDAQLFDTTILFHSISWNVKYSKNHGKLPWKICQMKLWWACTVNQVPYN